MKLYRGTALPMAMLTSVVISVAGTVIALSSSSDVDRASAGLVWLGVLWNFVWIWLLCFAISKIRKAFFEKKMSDKAFILLGTVILSSIAVGFILLYA
jgi:hypothetical protein